MSISHDTSIEFPTSFEDTWTQVAPGTSKFIARAYINPQTPFRFWVAQHPPEDNFAGAVAHKGSVVTIVMFKGESLYVKAYNG